MREMDRHLLFLLALREALGISQDRKKNLRSPNNDHSCSRLNRPFPTQERPQAEDGGTDPVTDAVCALHVVSASMGSPLPHPALLMGELGPPEVKGSPKALWTKRGRTEF